MKVKRILAYTTALLALGALAAGCHRHHGPPMSESQVDRMLEHIDDRFDDLEPTAAQRQQYQEVRRQIETDMRNGLTQRRTLMESVRRDLAANNPDVHAIAERVKAHMQERQSAMQSAPDRFVAVYDILNAEQKAKVIEELREHLERF